MVQAIENRAEIVGDVLGRREDKARPGHVLLRVSVREVAPQAGYPNLLAGVAGSTIEISARDSVIGPGPVRLSVKRAGPATFVAVPDPE